MSIRERVAALITRGTEREKAVAANDLAHLAVDAGNRTPIREAGGIPPLVALVSSGTDDRGVCCPT